MSDQTESLARRVLDDARRQRDLMARRSRDASKSVADIGEIPPVSAEFEVCWDETDEPHVVPAGDRVEGVDVHVAEIRMMSAADTAEFMRRLCKAPSEPIPVQGVDVKLHGKVRMMSADDAARFVRKGTIAPDEWRYGWHDYSTGVFYLFGGGDGTSDSIIVFKD